MTRLSLRSRRAVAAAGSVSLLLAAAVPAFGASTVNETLSNFKISGGSSAKAGKVAFKVKNTSQMTHEFIVIKTATQASKLKLSYGKPSERGSVGELAVVGGATKTLTFKNLKKGHYALICNVGNHYMAGMHKDFTVK